MKRKKYLATALLGLCGLAAPMTAPGQQAEKPKLVVFIVVDQMTAGHMSRFTDLYQHGLARFIRDGSVFTDGHQDHGVTVTGPGHATLSTGVTPARNGITENTWFDREQKRMIYCTRDEDSPILGYPDQEPGDGRSPRNMTFPALGDWLKAQSPGSKVYGVGRKDRSSILMAGKGADAAYWYNGDDGNMVTSTFYASAYPDWVAAFNQSRIVDRYFADGWQKLLPEDAYAVAREDSFPGEPEPSTFPHSFRDRSDSPDKAYYGRLQSTPFADELVLKFAEALITNEALGRDDAPDILYIGCDAADGVGHGYGPFSQESADLFFRLDRYLGAFFDFLDAEIGRDAYLVALSSDHGALPLPEELQRRHIMAGRIPPAELRTEVLAVIDAVSQELALPANTIKRAGSYYFIIDYELAAASGVAAQQIRDRLRSALTRLPVIAAVYFREELLRGRDTGDPYWQRFANSFRADQGYEARLRFTKFHIVSSGTGTTHGSAYEYDSHVPIAFVGPGIPQGTFTQTVRTVDVAPTLAELLGIRAPDDLDGRSLLGIMQQKGW